MIYSMTGFGKTSGKHGTKTFAVEVKSLNSKQTDIYVRIPSLYKQKEMQLRNMLIKKLERGKMELSLSVEDSGAESGQSINKSLVAHYYKQVSELEKLTGAQSADPLGAILRFPDVLQSEIEEIDDEEWAFVADLTEKAIDKLIEFRAQEGKKLKADFEKRIAIIADKLKVVEKHEAARIDNVKARMTKAFKELKNKENIDENRFEQELIYYLEKLDITEEKVRLSAHCDYFIETLNSESSQGKKLGFILQETGREINTIGSKANHAEIQRAVVQMKDELEKIKEQMLNVL